MWQLEISFDEETVILVETGNTQNEARQNMLKNWTNKKFSDYIFPHSRISLHHALYQGSEKKEDDWEEQSKHMYVWDGTFKEIISSKSYKSPLRDNITPEEAKKALTDMDELKKELERISNQPQHNLKKQNLILVKNMEEAIQKGHLEPITGTLFVSASSG